MNNLRAWAQLVRVPNTLTSCADVLAGMSVGGGFAHHYLVYPWAAILGSCASIALYWAGMVLNDVFDIEQDRQQGRPGPLVTGKISIDSARKWGLALLILGVICSALGPFAMTRSADNAPSESSLSLWLAVPGLIGVALAAAIYAYDGPCKKSWFAPWIMGICRGLNMSLGIALVAAVIPVALGPASAAVVIGHVLYISGVTIAARREADLHQSRSRLIAGWTICALGASSIAFSTSWEPTRPLRLEPHWVFPLMIAILMLPLGRRVLDAMRTLQPQRLGMAIRQAILSVLFLDAAIALQFSGDLPGIVICLMVLPTLLLSRWFRST